MTQHITTHDAIKLAEFIMDGGARIFEGLPPANPVKFSPARTSLTVAKARDLKAAQYFRGAGMVDCATIHTQRLVVKHYDEDNARKYIWVPE